MPKTEIVNDLLSERKQFILIGLTGRTGSGCTTAASILAGDQSSFPNVIDVTVDGERFFEGLDEKRFNILSNYAKENHQPFISIKVSDFITAYLLLVPTNELIDYIALWTDKRDEVAQLIQKSSILSKTLSSKSNDAIKKITNHDVKLELSKKEIEHFPKSLDRISQVTKYIKEGLNSISSDLFVTVYQDAGNKIRQYGKVAISGPEDQNAIKHLPETINRVVKGLRKHKGDKPCYIVIDAIRNPYEAKYFKDRYSAFYLVSVNAPNEDRISYLQKVHKYSLEQIKKLDSRESGYKEKKNQQDSKKALSSDLMTQNVKRCIEISDIHIFNPRKEPENHNVLASQLIWYTALMQHPGLVTPTSVERTMQFAISAKTNSGCISRQVGAVVTDQDYSVKSIGWNDVPKGQTPCNLRSYKGLKSGFDPVEYSLYERSDSTFRTVAEKKYQQIIHVEKSGRNASYCFKTVKNSIEPKENNQVHTRSLHAEENAFLQLTKYGTSGIEGGFLFTTASPCELCSKKAYQLGISKIFFVDPYPGIAIDHILTIGSKPPELVQFRGAVGKAYHQLYEPLMPCKDELEFMAQGSD